MGEVTQENIPVDPFVVGLILTQKAQTNGPLHPFADSFSPFLNVRPEVFDSPRDCLRSAQGQDSGLRTVRAKGMLGGHYSW